VNTTLVETFSNDFSNTTEAEMKNAQLTNLNVCGIDSSKYWKSNRVTNQSMTDQCTNRNLVTIQSTNFLSSALNTVDECKSITLTEGEGCINNVKVAWYVSNNSPVINGLEFSTSSGS
jgi:hypothetical protein